MEALREAQDRSVFACGEQALDGYFQRQVTQDIRRNITHCFVAVEAESGCVAGYYTLAATGIALADLPSDVARKLPRYPMIPAARVGRLAVDHEFHGRGLGAALLADAALRALTAAPAAFALVVDAKNESAVAFYRHHGFLPCSSQPRTLFLPLATAAQALLPKRK